jgi:general secretion pathway protein G
MIRTRPRNRGFTLIELVVTLTLVSVLALVAVPLYQVTVTHAKESELRTALRQMRTALDAYKAAADSGYIAKGAADSGFPATLAVLVQGVDTIASPVGAPSGAPLGAPSYGGSPGYGNGAPGTVSGSSGLNQSGGTAGNGAANSGSASTMPAHMVFLRQVPRDPFFEDQSVPPDQQWNIRAYGSPPDDFSGGADVYDVSTKSTAIGLNGIAYKDW